MKISIVGGNGFIGSALVAELKKQGHVIALPTRKELVNCPPTDGWGMLVWAAGLTADFRQRPLDTVDAHVCDLARLLRRDRVGGVLYLSSTRVYQHSSNTTESAPLACAPSNPSDLYNLSKLMGESLCLNSGVDRVKIARLSNIVGPGESKRMTFLGELCRQANSGHIELQTAFCSQKDYLWIDEAASILACLATDEWCGIMNVARGRQITHENWARRIAERHQASVSVASDANESSFPQIDVSFMTRNYGPSMIDPIEKVSGIAAV